MRSMSEEKKWKRGDIGPDGRVFWGRSAANGLYWISPGDYQKKREAARIQNTKWRSKHPEKHRKSAAEYKRKLKIENPEKYKRISMESNLKHKEAMRQSHKRRREQNHEEVRRRELESKRRRRAQSKSDQFFIMAGAAESLKNIQQNNNQ